MISLTPVFGFHIGSILGSILGGRWSDRTLARLKAANGGVSYPEVSHSGFAFVNDSEVILTVVCQMRLESTKLAMWWFPPSVIGYAWVCQQHVHISAICVMLFLSGFFSMCVVRRCPCPRLTFVWMFRWIYASTLAYIVDANVGRSSSAVATNSSFRGISAFVAAEIAIPLQVRFRVTQMLRFELTCSPGFYR